MLLVHQTGSVKVGETVRYTLTYTPSADRVLPTPSHLHVKVRNTCGVPLRAAYLRGPYTLYAACYPSQWRPDTKLEDAKGVGIPQFEPNLKAGGSWTGRITVPEQMRLKAPLQPRGEEGRIEIPSVTWIIEVTSQVLFSSGATVHYEILIGRDEKSIEMGLASLVGHTNTAPGTLVDHQQSRHRDRRGTKAEQARGLFSSSIKLVVDDTESLWNRPSLPDWPAADQEAKGLRVADSKESKTKDVSEGDVLGDPKGQIVQEPETLTSLMPERKKRKVHLVVISHGLHSNTGADMLYCKECIDAAAKQARLDARRRKKAEKAGISPIAGDSQAPEDSGSAPTSGGQETLPDQDEDDGVLSDEEEIVVRGFTGNVVKTEKGIQYLGKRMAKWILEMTYPDQPCIPEHKDSFRKSLKKTFTGNNNNSNTDDKEKEKSTDHIAHPGSTIHEETAKDTPDRAYKFTSISFIGHSLGGLTQAYAIAYIHKHSPDFFKLIKPINFIGLASPFLGLSNENPIYVKFALDFGVVGRTGRDLGLTWRPPNVVRSGWETIIGGLGTENARNKTGTEVTAKPLLRILPAGPAHQVLKMFRNRTIYSNIVNDGIVPLRTSSMLFLDWQGLDKVEKARRENGVIGTMASWGWAELTGGNSSERSRSRAATPTTATSSREDRETSPKHDHHGQNEDDVPQPSDDEDGDNVGPHDTPEIQKNGKRLSSGDINDNIHSPKHSPHVPSPSSPFAGFLSLLRPQGGHQKENKRQSHRPKHVKIYERSQTRSVDEESISGSSSNTPAPSTSASERRPGMADAGHDDDNLMAPPKTSVFEAAGDILNPPLPPEDFLIDPSSRPRTIFHDRVYHPEDIPPPPIRKRSTLARSFSSDKSDAEKDLPATPSTSGMKVEEKIARAYHRDLSWRKVLVRLEPDAHNNIIVRRMFANAYGWPVIKHLVDTHFSDSYSALTEDIREPNTERAMPPGAQAGPHGEEIVPHPRAGQGSDLDIRESADTEEPSDVWKKSDSHSSIQFANLDDSHMSHLSTRERLDRSDSARWTDRFFEDSDSGEEEGEGGFYEALHRVRNNIESYYSSHAGASSPPPPGTKRASLSGTSPDTSPKPRSQQASLVVPVDHDKVPILPTGLGLVQTASQKMKLGKSDEAIE